MEKRFAPGDVVVRREILRGEVWFGCPTVCVEDSADLLALYLPPGAEFGFPEHGTFPCGRHPWQTAEHTAWSGHGKLMLQRPCDPRRGGPDRRPARRGTALVGRGLGVLASRPVLDGAAAAGELGHRSLLTGARRGPAGEPG
ncbi:hypothetical protein [Micromonospora sp. DT47]|uniref:hypothetical protein n=1 Tax=Micromonospora sp. DT47 TaxID=3393431 RepID=UPI003CF48349